MSTLHGSWRLRARFQRRLGKNDYNLSPSRYVDTDTATEHRDVQEILDDLGKLEGEARKLDRDLKGIFQGLGYKWRAGS